MRQYRMLLILLLILVVAFMASAEAATFTVNDISDTDDGSCDPSPGDCTLREAINEAEANGWPHDIIVFDPALSGQTITLSSLLQSIEYPVTIDGDINNDGVPDITLDGGGTVDHAFQLFVWDDGALDPDIIIMGLRIQNFDVSGIVTTPSGQLNITRVEILNNEVGIRIYSNNYDLSKVWIKDSDIHHNNQQGIYITHVGGTEFTDIALWGNDIHDNGLQGIIIDGTTNPITKVRLDPVESFASMPLPNYIYGNGAEGILLVGDVYGVEVGTSALRIRGPWLFDNFIGVDRSLNPRPNGDGPGPNGDGGVIIGGLAPPLAGPHDNQVIANFIAYNYYNNIAILGPGTTNNMINANDVASDESLPAPIGNQGIFIGYGASSNIVSGNVVVDHRFEGIVVLGEGSDNNWIVDNCVGAFQLGSTVCQQSTDPTDGNGAGILVGCDAAPTIIFPFPVSGPCGPGPDGTVISGIIKWNHGDGVILINATDFQILSSRRGSDISENGRHGVYWIGSTGTIVSGRFPVIISGNGGDGVRIEPFYGVSAHPDNYLDDVISSGSILSAQIIGNAGWGVLIIDNPGFDLATLDSQNDLRSTSNGMGRAARYWLGYVRVEDPLGNPVTGVTVEIFRGGSDGDAVADYVSGSWDSNGRYGPTGFTYSDISTWWQILHEQIDNTGTYLQYNDHTFAINGIPVPGAIYAWNGLYPNPPGESGGAYESPDGSGAWRYQWALLTYRRPSAPIGGVVEQPGIIKPSRPDILDYGIVASIFLSIACLLYMVGRRIKT